MTASAFFYEAFKNIDNRLFSMKSSKAFCHKLDREKVGEEILFINTNESFFNSFNRIALLDLEHWSTMQRLYI